MYYSESTCCSAGQLGGLGRPAATVSRAPRGGGPAECMGATSTGMEDTASSLAGVARLAAPRPCTVCFGPAGPRPASLARACLVHRARPVRVERKSRLP